MKNIVSNNCFGGLICGRAFNKPAQNPFFYTWIDDTEFEKLVLLWDELDFSKVEPFYITDEYLAHFTEKEQYRFSHAWNRTGKKVLGAIKIDDKVLINFVHYHEIPENKKERVGKTERSVHNLMNYLVEKWHERIARMSGEPHFVVHVDMTCDIERMIKLKHECKHPFYICASTSRRNKPYHDEIDFLVPASEFNLWDIKSWQKFAVTNENWMKVFPPEGEMGKSKLLS